MTDYEQIGPYRLRRELGRGGQAVVYLAHDDRLNRDVALKVLRTGPAGDAGLGRFLREAQVASRLEHGGICPIYDTGQEGSVHYIAMRYIEGETLRQRLDQREKGVDSDLTFEDFSDEGAPDDAPVKEESSSGPSSREEIDHLIRIIERTARAAHVAHEAGFVHRDLKPGNVILSAEDEPVILDFGLAGELGGEFSTLTQSGDLLGTPAYMSPEQLTGHHITLDRRTDVYSLGVMLFECLTLERPFEAPTRQALYNAILSKDAVDPRRLNERIPKDLSLVVKTAMEKDRDRRYQTALAFAQDLRRVRTGESILAKPLPLAARAFRWVRRNALVATLSGLLMAALLTMAVLALHTANEQERLAAKERTARQNTQRVLAHGLIDRIRATRLAKLPGARASSLDLIRDANTLRRAMLSEAQEVPFDKATLRDEALLALTTPDAEVASSSLLLYGRYVTACPSGRYQCTLTPSLSTDALPQIRVLDLTNGEPLSSADLDPGVLKTASAKTRFALGEGAELLAVSGVVPEAISLLTPRDGKMSRDLLLPSDDDSVIIPGGLAFTEDGRHLVAWARLSNARLGVFAFDVRRNTPARWLARFEIGTENKAIRFVTGTDLVAITVGDDGVLLVGLDGQAIETSLEELPRVRAVDLAGRQCAVVSEADSGRLLLHVCDLSTKEKTCVVHTLAVRELAEDAIAFLPADAKEGALVAVVTSPPAITILSARDGSVVASIKTLHGTLANDLFFTPERLLVSTSKYGETTRWRLSLDRGPMNSLPVSDGDGHPFATGKLAIASSGRIAAQGATSSRVLVLDAPPRELSLEKLNEPLYRIAWSDDEQSFLAVSPSRVVLFDALTGTPRHARTIDESRSMFTSAGFSDTSAIACSSRRQRLALVDIATGVEQELAPCLEACITGMVDRNATVVAGIGIPIALSTLISVRLDTQSPLPPLDEAALSTPTQLLLAYISDDGKWITTAHDVDGTGRPGTAIWEVASGRLVFESRPSLARAAIALTFASVEPLVAMACADGGVDVHHMGSGERLFSWRCTERPLVDVAFKATENGPDSLLLASDGSATIHTLDMIKVREALARLALQW